MRLIAFNILDQGLIDELCKIIVMANSPDYREGWPLSAVQEVLVTAIFEEEGQ